MSWLRLDDGYDTHPKLLELTELQRWRWTRVLIHCAKHRTEGHVKRSVLRELGLDRALTELVSIGLLEENGSEGYLVHDFMQYNADTIGGRVAAFLEEHPDASANEIYRAIGGKRELVLAEVAAQRGSQEPEGNQQGTDEEPPWPPLDEPEISELAGSLGTTEPVPKPVPEEPVSGSQSGSHARAPRPSPTPTALQALSPQAVGPALPTDSPRFEIPTSVLKDIA